MDILKKAEAKAAKYLEDRKIDFITNCIEQISRKEGEILRFKAQAAKAAEVVSIYQLETLPF